MGDPQLANPQFARMYVRVSAETDRRGGAEHRHRLLAGLHGRVCEVGAGNGRNFAHYPSEVTRVVAVEPEPTLRGFAEEAARDASVPVTVVAGRAEALPVETASCDAAVASLVLCSIADLPVALAELRRVLRPGGELRFYEHVRSAGWVRGRLQDAVAPLWARLAAGCHPNRDAAEEVRRAGFVVEQVERFGFRPQRYVPPIAHVIGRATRV